MKRIPILLLLALAACSGDKQSAAISQGEEAAPPAQPETPDPKLLLDPDAAAQTAPEKFQVRLETTKGDVVVECVRDWAPNGVDRFYTLVRIGYFEDIVFFRVIPGFMAQFGMHGDPEINRIWMRAFIRADPTRESNRRGRVTFAQAGNPSTRTVQLFINYAHNASLDRTFAPFGEVIDGMNVVDSLHAGYGDEAPGGTGPAQGRLLFEGNAYLEEFPELDYIKRAVLVE